MTALAGAAAAQLPNSSANYAYTDNYDNLALGIGVLTRDQASTANGQVGTAGAVGVASTGVGYGVLANNTTGAYNSGVGAYALLNNTTGFENTGLGYAALYTNVTGAHDTAVGHDALEYNTTGHEDTAVGTYALQQNQTGNFNTATGYEALGTNTTGIFNAAFGAGALLLSQAASENTALGTGTLYHDTTGASNTASGFTALFNATTGSYNTAVGAGAGTALTTGSYNTYVGYNVNGAATDAYVTRIGVQNAAATTYVAGIFGTALSGQMAPVMINANGQLGAVVSSERYKTAIAPLGSTADKLSQLRPVSFHLKNDPQGVVQYGLIAEEVDKVYPELVIHDNAGQIQGVRYDELAPLLLGELQRQQQAYGERIAQLEGEVAALHDLKGQMQALLAQWQAAQVAQR
jgi:hypothetical protein